MNVVTEYKVMWLLNPKYKHVNLILSPYIHPTMYIAASSPAWSLVGYLDVLWLFWDSA